MSKLKVNEKIREKLNQLVTGEIEEIDVKQLCVDIWGGVIKYDYHDHPDNFFRIRSFDVQYHNLKKSVYEDFKFKRKNGIITII